MIRDTVQIGVPVIRSKARKVSSASDSHVQSVIQDLIDTMRASGLVGMAAPQIGESLRIFVSEVRKTQNRPYIKDTEQLRIFINPTITNRSKREVMGYEGCGSFASAAVFGQVKRPYAVEVAATDENGEPFTVKATGLLARILQHEIDHLDGVLYIDRVSDTKKLLDEHEYRKLRTAGNIH